MTPEGSQGLGWGTPHHPRAIQREVASWHEVCSMRLGSAPGSLCLCSRGRGCLGFANLNMVPEVPLLLQHSESVVLALVCGGGREV